MKAVNILPAIAWHSLLIWGLLLGLNSLPLMAADQASIGALPIPGSNNTSEYLTLNQHGTILENDKVNLEWQGDGNLVIYNAVGKAIWASATADSQKGGKGGQELILAPDGKLSIQNIDGNAIWQINTGG